MESTEGERIIGGMALAALAIGATVGLLSSKQAQVTPTGLATVPVGLVAYDQATANYLTLNLRPTDLGTIPFEGFTNRVDATALPHNQVAYAYGAFNNGVPTESIQSALPTLPANVGWVIYDPEHNTITPSNEQAALPATCQMTQAAVHATGRFFAVVPDADFTIADAALIAPYADLYILQAQRYQNDPTGQFASFVAAQTAAIKAIDPAIPVWVQVQVTTQFGNVPPNDPVTAYTCIAGLPVVPDGLFVFSFDNYLGSVQQFMALARPNG